MRERLPNSYKAKTGSTTFKIESRILKCRNFNDRSAMLKFTQWYYYFIFKLITKQKSNYTYQIFVT